MEDSAFGFIKMKNGATIYLEASWALNTLDVNEAKTILCGDKGGADMLGKDGGLRINGEKYSKTFVTEPDLKAGGVAFYDGTTGGDPAELEAGRGSLMCWTIPIRSSPSPSRLMWSRRFWKPSTVPPRPTGPSILKTAK